MRSPAHPRSVPALLLVAALSFAACSGSKKSGLSYAQVQTIQPGLSATQVRDSFGPPASVTRDPNGRVTRMEYAAMDAKQSGAKLFLDFDGQERLVTKTYTGAVVRPK